LALRDALTGLYGRHEFNDRLKHDLALAQRRKTALSLAYVDVDYFKAVNDTYGHDSGDRVVRAIADALKKRLRVIDTPAGLGGDEFTLIFPDTDSERPGKSLQGLSASSARYPKSATGTLPVALVSTPI